MIPLDRDEDGIVIAFKTDQEDADGVIIDPCKDLGKMVIQIDLLFLSDHV